MTVGTSPPEKTAPAPLDLVQWFVNSVNLLRGGDELTSPAELRAWLAERDLIDAGERVTEADLRRALDVREGLRALLSANAGMPLDEDRVARLDEVAARAGVRVVFPADGPPELAPAGGGVDGALARLLAIVAGAAESGEWERLKVCSRDECRWAFYDRAKNRSGRWCEMSVCGNVEKARAFRERHHERRKGSA
jgi:predicted RNA-binding Zn ribbon-like protein